MKKAKRENSPPSQLILMDGMLQTIIPNAPGVEIPAEIWIQAQTVRQLAALRDDLMELRLDMRQLLASFGNESG